jgi:hypothetical protein
MSFDLYDDDDLFDDGDDSAAEQDFGDWGDGDSFDCSQEEQEFTAKFVRENVPCPICGVAITQYVIPTDRLWVWPGVWPEGRYYSPMIGLMVFADYGIPKGEVHGAVTDATGTYWHVWIGTGEYRREQLIKLTGDLRQSAT